MARTSPKERAKERMRKRMETEFPVDTTGMDPEMKELMAKERARNMKMKVISTLRPDTSKKATKKKGK